MDVVIPRNTGTTTYIVKKKTSNWYVVRSMSNQYDNNMTTGTGVSINDVMVPVNNMASSIQGVFGCSVHIGNYELNVGDVVKVYTANVDSVNSWFFCEY